MKRALIILAAAAALASPALSADPVAGPADKKDGGSLSSGAKDVSPATKGTGETAPVGKERAANEGASPGSTGSSSDPLVPAEAGKSTPDTKGSPEK